LLHNNDNDNVVDLAEYDIERLARKVGVLKYEPPIYLCPLCGTPTSGVFCTPCATK